MLFNDPRALQLYLFHLAAFRCVRCRPRATGGCTIEFNFVDAKPWTIVSWNDDRRGSEVPDNSLVGNKMSKYAV